MAGIGKEVYIASPFPFVKKYPDRKKIAMVLGLWATGDVALDIPRAFDRVWCAAIHQNVSFIDYQVGLFCLISSSLVLKFDWTFIL